jgi:ribosomal protein S18 acetylase RimI-like enzyme
MDLLQLVRLLFMLSAAAIGVHSILITPPQSSKDWRQLADLLVNVFDAPLICGTLDKLTWRLFEKERTTQIVYQRHIDTARQFQGLAIKYKVFLAKQGDKVVGMVEMGVVPSTSPSTSRRATLGVLCVDPSWQGLSVGTMLLNKCHDEVRNRWNETRLYCDVEESNEGAYLFFTKRGYISSGQIVTAKVQRKRQLEDRPHMVLCKELLDCQLTIIHIWTSRKEELFFCCRHEYSF